MSRNNPIFRAGIIPFFIEDGNIYFNFMKPSDPRYGGDDWQIAKGRVENDDDNLSTAIREGAEELGLKESNITDIIELGEYLGRTSMFICNVKDRNDFDPFHYETGDVIWMTKDEFVNNGRKLHLPIVLDAYDYVIKNFVDME